MTLTDTQMPQEYLNIINNQIDIFGQPISLTDHNTIPDSCNIPLVNRLTWVKIPDVICVYIDMKGSTQLSAHAHSKSTAAAYELYTGTAVRLLHEFEAPYIDVRGDGAFGLFNSNQPYRALAAAVTFKTFARHVFTPKMKDKTGLSVGSHIGIDMKTVLVRRVGLRQSGSTTFNNEVWAGKPVNMAAKLASLTEDDELIVSDRFFQKIRHDIARLSCGCKRDDSSGEMGEKSELWTDKDLSEDDRFDFDLAHSLTSQWCPIHGKEYCLNMLRLDK